MRLVRSTLHAVLRRFLETTDPTLEATWDSTHKMSDARESALFVLRERVAAHVTRKPRRQGNAVPSDPQTHLTYKLDRKVVELVKKIFTTGIIYYEK